MRHKGTLQAPKTKQLPVSRSSPPSKGHREGRGERGNHQHAIFTSIGGRGEQNWTPPAQNLNHHIQSTVIWAELQSCGRFFLPSTSTIPVVLSEPCPALFTVHRQELSFSQFFFFFKLHITSSNHISHSVIQDLRLADFSRLPYLHGHMELGCFLRRSWCFICRAINVYRHCEDWGMDWTRLWQQLILKPWPDLVQPHQSIHEIYCFTI